MANPVILELNEWEWVKVATNVSTGSIHLMESRVYYYQTYRLTGGVAPTVPTIGEIPDEAVKIFNHSNQVPISSNTFIDVYIMCANRDDIKEVNAGKLRVDL